MVEKVSSYDHEVWLQLDRLLHDFMEGSVEIFTASSEIVLLVTQMKISDMNKTEWLQTNSSFFSYRAASSRITL